MEKTLRGRGESADSGGPGGCPWIPRESSYRPLTSSIWQRQRGSSEEVFPRDGWTRIRLAGATQEIHGPTCVGPPLQVSSSLRGKYTRTVWGHKFGPGARQSLAQDHRYPVELRANLDLPF